ncbi:transposase [Nocardioides sp. B-3]|uniref:transposase n=1 Tax=Nocardioides sp. B-3 TaxID=2895565 RepID=UPI0021522ABC|nr:transposase [Nocardioides sp. B-3]
MPATARWTTSPPPDPTGSSPPARTDDSPTRPPTTRGPAHHRPTRAPLERMRHQMKTPEGLAAYAHRGATAEPVNAHLKDQTGLRRFSRRGLAAATSELNLAAAVVNLLKLHRHTTAALAT